MPRISWFSAFCLAHLTASLASFDSSNGSTFSWTFEPDSNIIFHSYIIEKNNEIITYPPLHVNLESGTKLCQVHLLATETHTVPTFISAYVSDPIRGYCELRLNESALYQARLHNDNSLEGGVYHLKVLAEDCSSPSRLTRPWTINIVLVPTEHPVWSDRSYSFSVPSSLPAGEIVGKVIAYAAFDFDPGPEFLANRMGDDTGMCAYSIEHPSDSPFDVNGNGVIRSRTVFTSFSQTGTRFDFNVTGFDCHMPVSRRSTVSVTVFVRPECAPHWQGLNEELIYPSLATPQLLSPMAELKSCDLKSAASSEQCGAPEHASIRVKLLWTDEDDDHVDNGLLCDLDLLSLRAQRYLCGLANTIELLPPNTPELPSLPTDDQRSLAVSSFNGSNAWSVPENLLPQAKHRLDNVHFTLSFWMNHSTGSVRTGDSSTREHVLCVTDDHEKNRHHFAVFVRNCKLIVLLRREPINPVEHELYQLYPSQWRFVVDEVCDSAWHHYSLVFRPPPANVVQGSLGRSSDWHIETELKLFIDGELVPADPELVHITEKLPMRKLHEQLEPTLFSVGACWHAGQGKFVEYFVGDLAGLTLTREVAESDARLQCLVNCKPRLHMTGQPMGRNSENSELPALHRSHVDNLAFEAPTFNALSGLLRTVVFFNPRLRRSPDKRPEPVGILVTTNLGYSNACSVHAVPDKLISIVHLPANERTLTLLSTAHENRLLMFQSDRIFPDIFSSVPTDSLVLTKIGSDPVELSPVALQHQGIWLFPSLDLSWKRLATAKATDMEHRGIASYCDIALCPEHPNVPQPRILNSHESVTVDEEFLSSSLNLSLTNDGLRLDGPAKVEEFNRALSHVRWVHEKPILLSMRCFQVKCAAEFETVNNVVSNGPLKVQSNSLQSVYRIRHAKSQPTSADELHAHNETILALPKVSRDLHSVSLMDPVTPSPFRSSKMAYIVAACVTTLLILLIVVLVVGITRTLRSTGVLVEVNHHHPHNPLKLHRASPKRISAQSPANLPHDSSMMQLITNPVTNEEEVTELEKKFCFYDRQTYGGELEEIATASEMNAPPIA